LSLGRTALERCHSQFGCASCDIDDRVRHEIAPEVPDTYGSHAAGDGIDASLASDHADKGQSLRRSALLPVSTSDEQPIREPPVGTAEAIPPPNAELTTALRLQDVIDSVYASHPLLEAAFLSRLIADGELLSSQGAFDLKLKGGGTSGPLGFYKTHRFGAGASQPLFSGGDIFGGYKIGRGNFQPWFGERETDDGGEFSAGIAIPLAQNRQVDERRSARFRAAYGRDAVEPNIQTRTIAFIWEASYAYWQWVAAGRNNQISRSLLEIAQQRSEGLTIRVDAGDLPRIELTDNQRLIVSRQAALIDAERKLRQSAIKLSLFLRTVGGQPIVPARAQLPAAFPEAAQVAPEQMDGDIQRALPNRPELQLLDFQRLQLEVDLAQARNLYLPAVDAVLFASKDTGRAASSKRDKTPFELEASLQVSVPLQRRKARGKIQLIEGKLRQLSAKIRFTQDKIATEVQQVYAARSAAYDRIAKARESLELAHTMEQAERRKFELGDSNLLLVNLRELATADAAKTVLQAMLDYFRSQADYRAAMALDVNPGVAK
ncbi:MAG: TolC family protein, partial [Pirellulaceae bacterium]